MGRGFQDADRRRVRTGGELRLRRQRACRYRARHDAETDAKADSGSTVTVSVALSRGAELEQAALSYLGGLRDSGSTVTVGGTAYLVESVDAVKYEGGETTSFTITGKAVTSLDGETVYGSSKQKSGAIVWTSDNAIASIS